MQINNVFGPAKKGHTGVPQCSIGEPLLFNLFINDSLLFLTDIFLSNCTDDNNLYITEKEKLCSKRKCHYMCIGRNTENGQFEFDYLCYNNNKLFFTVGFDLAK